MLHPADEAAIGVAHEHAGEQPAFAKNLEAATKGINRLVNSDYLQRSLYDLQNTFQETRRAMHTFSLLSEYLEQHPEAFLKGKVGQ